mmetsp:Transcript_1113/g.4088  ORF Transcript_1113/g.4088 Transcript_1113/m.4088 type:complete len:241 (+) Transcript_1113:1230-1952(+)
MPRRRRSSSDGRASRCCETLSPTMRRSSDVARFIQMRRGAAAAAAIDASAGASSGAVAGAVAGADVVVAVGAAAGARKKVEKKVNPRSGIRDPPSQPNYKQTLIKHLGLGHQKGSAPLTVTFDRTGDKIWVATLKITETGREFVATAGTKKDADRDACKAALVGLGIDFSDKRVPAAEAAEAVDEDAGADAYDAAAAAAYADAVAAADAPVAAEEPAALDEDAEPEAAVEVKAPLATVTM